MVLIKLDKFDGLDIFWGIFGCFGVELENFCCFKSRCGLKISNYYEKKKIIVF